MRLRSLPLLRSASAFGYTLQGKNVFLSIEENHVLITHDIRRRGPRRNRLRLSRRLSDHADAETARRESAG